MLAFSTVFIALMVLFAILGMMRGWAKEIVATVGIILALFIDERLLSLAPIQGVLAALADDRSRFWVRAAIFLLITFFAYQGPSLSQYASARLSSRGGRENLQEALLGLVIGVINGYLILGTLWYFLRLYCYPFPTQFMLPPIDGVPGLPTCQNAATGFPPEAVTTLAQAGQFVGYLPQVWITPYLPYLLALFVLFLMIVFV